MLLELNQNLTVFQSAFWQLNSTCLYHHGTALLWDPAYSSNELESIQIHVQRNPQSESYIIYTHGDYDHIVGYSRFEGSIMVGSERMDQKTNKAFVCSQAKVFDQEIYLIRDYEIRFPTLDVLVPQLKSGCKKQLGNVEAIFYQASGHTPDGLFTIIPEFGLWVGGDYLSDIEFPFIEDTIAAYRDSLDTCQLILKDFDLEFMVPGHGSVAISRQEIQRRIDQSSKYLDSLQGQAPVPDWRETWGPSPFSQFLDKMHLKNIRHVRSQSV